MKQKLLASAAMIALTSGVVHAQVKFPVGEDATFNWASLDAFKQAHGDLAGQKLTVLGPWLGGDKDLFESVIPYFEEATGVQVDYSGSSSFEQQIVIDAEAGSPPDVAIFPQPGLAAGLAAKGS